MAPPPRVSTLNRGNRGSADKSEGNNARQYVPRRRFRRGQGDAIANAGEDRAPRRLLLLRLDGLRQLPRPRPHTTYAEQEEPANCHVSTFLVPAARSRRPSRGIRRACVNHHQPRICSFDRDGSSAVRGSRSLEVAVIAVRASSRRGGAKLRWSARILLPWRAGRSADALTRLSGSV